MEYEDYPNLNFTNIKPSNPKPNGNERRGEIPLRNLFSQQHAGLPGTIILFPETHQKLKFHSFIFVEYIYCDNEMKP